MKSKNWLKSFLKTDIFLGGSCGKCLSQRKNESHSIYSNKLFLLYLTRWFDIFHCLLKIYFCENLITLLSTLIWHFFRLLSLDLKKLKFKTQNYLNRIEDSIWKKHPKNLFLVNQVLEEKNKSEKNWEKYERLENFLRSNLVSKKISISRLKISLKTRNVIQRISC